MPDLDYKINQNEVAINKLEVELSALKEKVSFFNVIYGKFDVTLGKIQEMIENRRYENNEEIKEVYARLESTEKRLLEEMKSIRADMKEQHEEDAKRIGDIDKWRWMVVGAAGVVGFLINKFFGVSL